jgi:3-phosphoshikimate 1-carboxyvinyltransferase
VAEGVTRMEGLAELRVKESDRLAVMEAGLKQCGINARSDGDTLIVEGMGKIPGGATIATHMDHRIAMTFLMLGLASESPISVDDTTMIRTSFPNFTELMTGLGARFGSQ